jgi:hypothetical protein
MTVFGPLIAAPDVERAVLNTLQYWLESYLRNRELMLQLEWGDIERIRTWKITNTFDDKEAEDQTPFLCVISDGLAGRPLQEGNGEFRAKWDIGIGIIVASATGEDAQRVVKDVYCPVIRQILLHKQSLRDWTDPDAQPFSSGVEWVDESYKDVFGDDASRTLFNGQLDFEVEVSSVVSRYGGPATPVDPDSDPGSSWPTADSGDIRVLHFDEV